MNKIFKVIWNRASQSWTVVSELGKAQGKAKVTSTKTASNIINISKVTLTVGAMLGSSDVISAITEGVGHDGRSNFALGLTSSVDINGIGAIAFGQQASSTKTSIAIGCNTTATNRSVAIGVGAVAHGVLLHGTSYGTATALGDGAKATDSETTAIGQLANASGNSSTSIGASSIASSNQSVAVGKHSHSTGIDSLALGPRANATMTEAIAVGAWSNARQYGSIALGAGANSVEEYSIAIGYDAEAVKKNSLAIGTKSIASEQNATAIGVNSYANGSNAIVVGSNAKTIDITILGTSYKGDNAIIIGRGAQGSIDAVAIGKNAFSQRVGDASTVAIGENAVSYAGVAIGQEARTLQDPNTKLASASVAIGRYTTAGEYAIAIGTSASAGAELGNIETKIDGSLSRSATVIPGAIYTTAIGIGASATKVNASAFGASSSAAGQSSIAMGNGASVSAMGEKAIAIGTKAKATAKDAVAIGSDVNVSGTCSTAVGVGNVVTGNYSGAFGDPNTVRADGSYAFGNNNTIEASAMNAFILGSCVTATTADSVILGKQSVGSASVMGCSTAKVGGISYGTFAGSTVDSGEYVSIGSQGDERKIIYVAAGNIDATSTDAINGSQLYATQHVLGNVTTSVDTILGGNANVAPTGEITMSNIGGTTKNTVDQAIAAVKETVVQGKNTTVTEEVKPNGSTTYKIDAVDTSASVSVGSTELTVGKNGPTAAGNADVTNYVIDLSEKTKANITHGVNANTTVTNKGLTFTADSGTGTLRKLGEELALNGDRDLIATTVSNGKVEIAATKKLTDAVINATNALQSFTTTVDGTTVAQTVTKTQNKANFKTGDNIELIAEVDGIKIATKDDVEFNNLTVNGDTVVNDFKVNPTVNVDMGGNTITNVGDPNADTDAANKKYVKATRTLVTSQDQSVTIKRTENGDAISFDLQVKPTVNAGWNIAANGTNSSNVGSDENVSLNNTDGNILITKDTADNNVTFGLNNNLTIGKDGANGIDGKVGVKGKDGSSVVLNGKDGSIGLTGPRGADGTTPSATIRTEKGQQGVDGQPGETKTRIVYETPDGKKEEVATLNDGLKFVGDKGEVIKKKLNETLAIKGKLADTADVTDKNLRVDNNGNEFIIKMAKALTDLTNATFTAGKGNTVIDGNGVIITPIEPGKSPVSLTNTGLNNGGNKITNVTKGTDDTDAVNVSQLKDVNATANAGWNLTINEGKDSSNVAPKATVDLANKDGNILITKDKTNVTFALNNDLTVGGKDGVNGANGKDGKIGVKGANGKTGVTLNGKDGSIGINGKDGSNGTITLAKGKPGVNGNEDKTRITYQPVDEKGNPKGTPEQVATLSDGLKFVGDVGDVIKKELNDTLTIKGNLSKGAEVTDKNLRVDNVNGALILKMAKSLQELTNATFVDNAGNRSVIDGNGLTITPKAGSGKAPVSLTDKGLNNGGNQVTNVSSGLVDNKGQKVDLANATGDVLNNAVNVGDLKNSINNLTNATTGGFGLTGDDGKSAKADLGKTVTVQGDGSVVTKVVKGKDGKDALQVSLSNDVTIGNGKEPGKVTVKGENGKDGVVLNGKDGSAEFKDADGKTTVAINGKDGTIGLNGKDGVATKVDGNGVTITGGANGTVNLTDKGLNNGGNTITNVAAGVNATDAVNVNQLKDATAAATAKVEAGKNTVVTPTKNADGSTTYTVATKDEVDFTKVATGNTTMTNEGVKIGDLISLTENGLNNGGKKATNIADGDISATSKDAVNGSQLHATNQNITNLQNTVAKGWNIEADTVDGSTGKVIGKSKAKVAMGDTVAVKAGNNIEITQEGKNIAIATSANPNFDSVKIGKGSNTAIISTTEDGAINVANANGGPTRITNVAAGKKDNDAVNVAQLKGAMSNINNNINAVNNKVDKVDRDLRAGIAGAMAAGNLYHVTIPGKSMVSAGIGTYKNQGAVAVGYSRLSDNGKIGVKFSVNTNTRGDSGAAASVGYQW
ncbi:YadA-like family protein [Actinobacillus equuli]|uniref:YadA-like family protein n=1 Tax=Actinobacillus equuli TaxID=718 RepID=UPI00244217DE|nr:YadA-like family protein [Actinobacillus equuli]WGE48724.1 YadA-like family protein [Actinobacillus equuli subsp. equuli]